MTDAPLPALYYRLSVERVSSQELKRIVQAMGDSEIAELAAWLNAQADHFRVINKAAWAYLYGYYLRIIGQTKNSLSLTGIGFMICGDARNSVASFKRAWQQLETASQLHLQDTQNPQANFNWARTIIGKWLAATTPSQIAQVHEKESRAAETIFYDAGDNGRLLGLFQNMAINLARRGRFTQALLINMRCENFGDQAAIYVNLGAIYIELGHANEAEQAYKEALAKKESPQTILAANQGLALVYILRAQYQEALRTLNENFADPNADLVVRRYVCRTRCACYLEMGDLDSARREVEALQNMDLGKGDMLWYVYNTLAILEAERGHFTNAARHLRAAISAASAIGHEFGEMTSIMTRGQIALQKLQKDDLALADAANDLNLAHNYFDTIAHGHLYKAKILLAELAYKSKDFAQAEAFCQDIADHYKTRKILGYQYEVNTLRGNIARDQQQPQAASYYQQALAHVHYVQGDLAIAHSPGFLSNKGEALHGLLNLLLERGQIAEALNYLLASKAQTMKAYLTRTRGHDWEPNADAVALQEMQRLRREFVSLAYASGIEIEEAKKQNEPETIYQQTTQLSRQLTQINNTHHQRAAQNAQNPDLDAILAKLPANAALICYFDDGKDVRAFVLRHGQRLAIKKCCNSAEALQLQKSLIKETQTPFLSLHHLPASQYNTWQAVFNHSLLTNETRRLTFQVLAEALYKALIDPLLAHLEGCKRLYIMPHRGLHAIPFQLLVGAQNQPLLAQYELVLLPAANWLNAPPKVHQGGPLVVYDERGGQLKHSASDALTVNAIIGGQRLEAPTNFLQFLRQQTGDILHLIAHASFAENSTARSFIQLDGQNLYISDLLQHELHFRLVALTACQTARQQFTENSRKLAYGDDQVGIANAFLYAGAQAVVASQFPIGDGLSQPFFTTFYKAIRAGDSVPAALRNAQLSLRDAHPDLHPVFWGNYQLTGHIEQL
jgi:CHAT domain-containing protein/tetratricopeptide (TPR) repeat protein